MTPSIVETKQVEYLRARTQLAQQRAGFSKKPNLAWPPDQYLSEETRAAAITNGIFSLCQEAADKGQNETKVLSLSHRSDFDPHEYFMHPNNPESSLKGAAKTVWEYCQKHGLNPTIGSFGSFPFNCILVHW